MGNIEKRDKKIIKQPQNLTCTVTWGHLVQGKQSSTPQDGRKPSVTGQQQEPSQEMTFERALKTEQSLRLLMMGRHRVGRERGSVLLFIMSGW